VLQTALIYSMLPNNFYRAPVTGAEVPALRLRDKAAIVGWSTQNVMAFLVTFTVPYLLQAPYAALGSKVGFIYGGFCVMALLWAWFCFPELRGRSLEEIDEMFQLKLPTRQFKGKPLWLIWGLALTNLVPSLEVI
jgi:Sugar (and other) transporter